MARFCSTVCSTLLVALLLLSPLALAQDRRTFTVPFDLHQGLILLKGEVNGKAAVMLLDTGANTSVVDPASVGLNLKLDKLRPTNAGGEGSCGVVKVRITLGRWDQGSRNVCVWDLSDISKNMGTRVDGFIGADVLGEFSAVRIDFKNHVVEFEK